MVFDKAAIVAAGIKDFQFDAETTSQIIAFYVSCIENTNRGEKAVRVSCEVSDFASKAKCIAEMQ